MSSIEDRLLTRTGQHVLPAVRKRWLERNSYRISALLMSMTEADTLDYGIGLAACYNEMVLELMELERQQGADGQG
jgi:hypothetical protein